MNENVLQGGSGDTEVLNDHLLDKLIHNMEYVAKLPSRIILLTSRVLTFNFVDNLDALLL